MDGICRVDHPTLTTWRVLLNSRYIPPPQLPGRKEHGRECPLDQQPRLSGILQPISAARNINSAHRIVASAGKNCGTSPFFSMELTAPGSRDALMRTNARLRRQRRSRDKLDGWLLDAFRWPAGCLLLKQPGVHRFLSKNRRWMGGPGRSA